MDVRTVVLKCKYIYKNINTKKMRITKNYSENRIIGLGYRINRVMDHLKLSTKR